MTDVVIYCGFCGKSHHDVERMVAGAVHVAICDECIVLAAYLCADNEPPAKHFSIGTDGNIVIDHPHRQGAPA